MLQIILRVDRSAASDDIFEDEASGDEADASGDDDADASGEDEESGSDDGADADEDLPAAIDAAMAAGSGDDDESDVEDADDETMFKMDGKIAEYFKALRSSKTVRALSRVRSKRVTQCRQTEMRIA